VINRVLKWVFGGGLSGIAHELQEAYSARLDATNDAERIKADERIARARSQVDAMRVGGLASVVRAAWAGLFFAYEAKLILWDKMLGWGVTDPLNENQAMIEMIVIGFFFLDSTVDRVRRR